MNDYHRDEVDAVLKAYVQHKMQGGELPGAAEMWERFRRTRQAARKRRFLNLSAVAVLLVICVLGAVALLFPQQLKALGERISSGRIILQGNRGSIRQTQTHTSGPGAPKEPGGLTTFELKKRAPSFPILGPRYVPAGYVFQGHSLTPLGEHQMRITSYYEKEGHYLTIVQEAVFHYSESQWFDTDDTVISDINIRGAPGKLLYRRKDGWSKVIWSKGGIRYEISARVSQEEIVKVAVSLEPL